MTLPRPENAEGFSSARPAPGSTLEIPQQAKPGAGRGGGWHAEGVSQSALLQCDFDTLPMERWGSLSPSLEPGGVPCHQRLWQKSHHVTLEAGVRKGESACTLAVPEPPLRKVPCSHHAVRKPKPPQGAARGPGRPSQDLKSSQGSDRCVHEPSDGPPLQPPRLPAESPDITEQ